MTREKWEKMTVLAKQLKVLELAGEVWEVKPYDGISRWKRNGVSVMEYIKPADVLNDLNAMFGLEKLIPREDRIAYTFLLSGMWNVYGRNEFCGDKTDLHKAESSWDAAHATAAERAEAFVLVMEKEESNV